ncbi:dihydroorotase [Parendozoicomonas sp. Alg238-R29]|uniref:dihydroorotase n=1 Tax=Parendozoicomonas sp. Alg238-R29 TaxID=2993446 RepID=UPI00248F1179|nr:dihydroorotase [Parendozoicomonas sp. Alg238-R29]
MTLTRPDDFHLHLRDGDALATTVPATANTFGRAIIMPNLKPPVTTAAQAAEYKQRIMAHVPEGSGFDPLMTLYLTDQTSPEIIHEAQAGGDVRALKLYPAGATTNSDSGVTALDNVFPALEAMIDAGIPLLVHGEVTDSDIDIFDREKVFIDRHLIPLVTRYPELKVVLEHITTVDAVAFVSETGANVAATITPQHLMYNRNHMLVGGIRPHYYCLPILKRNIHQQALVKAATSGDSKFFLGTDSAPHTQDTKETSCGCAGCYSAFGAIELYAEVFEKENALDKLEGFASHFGADFYDIPRNTDTITLVKKEQLIPESIPFAGSQVVPLKAGEHLQWSRSV